MARRGSRLDVDIEALTRLYVGERRTLDDVARHLGVSTATATRRLIEIGISRRPTGPLPRRVRSAAVGSGASVTWNANIAWIVGVLATDGNLGRDGRHLTLVSKDVDLLETVRRILGIAAKITPHPGGQGRCHRLQWSDSVFHEWVSRIGLMPAKSLRLEALAVPDEYFRDFFRGCIDGDGSITVYTDRYHTRKNDRYVYERLWVSLVSASSTFITWIEATVFRLNGIRGSMTVRHRDGCAPMWQLKFGKGASMDLIRWMYYAPDVPSLERKRLRARRFLDVLGYAESRPRGRPRVGWLYNNVLGRR